MKKILLIILIIFFNSKNFADDKMILGLEVYNNKAQCGLCHTLEAADSDSQIGPNLDQLKPQTELIIYKFICYKSLLTLFLQEHVLLLLFLYLSYLHRAYQ